MTRCALLALVVAVAACHHGAVKPSSPTCDQVADHVMSLLDSKNERAKPVREVFAKRCAADAWPDEAKACMVDESSVHGGRHCKDRLPGTARESLDHDLADIDAPKPPPECADYTKAFLAMQKCDKLPKAKRDQLSDLYNTTAQRWAQPGGDRSELPEICKNQQAMFAQIVSRAGCDASGASSTP